MEHRNFTFCQKAQSLFVRSVVCVMLSLGLGLHPAAAQKPVLTTLHRFDGPYGQFPFTPLTLGRDGNLYGVTEFGGSAPANNQLAPGVVFQMTPQGQFTTLWRFNGKNGAYPACALIEGTDGAFYGTTSQGGRSGYGTAFRITTQGRLTTLHAFTSDEGVLIAGLTLAPDGSFYGVSYLGGSQNVGTVFHMTASGTVTILHSFTGSDGSGLIAALIFGPDGALYGTTFGGGTQGFGTVFRITTQGVFTTLHSFTGDGGAFPTAGLTRGPDGAFYGTTQKGGIHIPQSGIGSGYGVTYKITPSGQFTLLHKFTADGRAAFPQCALTLGADGLFYGTTGFGGVTDYNDPAIGRGVVFVMTPQGHVTTLYKFHTDFDGHNPYSGVVFGLDGALYGATSGGGTKHVGTIFKLTLSQ